MGLLFRKRIKILPGVTLNLSKSGVSATIGRKGMSVSLGRRGAYLNAGIPGSGIYSRTRLDKASSRRKGKDATKTQTDRTISGVDARTSSPPSNPSKTPADPGSAVALLKCIALIAFIGLCLACIWRLLA